jgi:hypothetical protein
LIVDTSALRAVLLKETEALQFATAMTGASIVTVEQAMLPRRGFRVDGSGGGLTEIALCEQEAPAWFRYWPTEFARGFQPLGDHDFGVGDGFLAGGAIGGASCKFRHIGDEGIVIGAPIENDLVLCHSGSGTSLYRMIIPRTCFTW